MLDLMTSVIMKLKDLTEMRYILPTLVELFKCSFRLAAIYCREWEIASNASTMPSSVAICSTQHVVEGAVNFQSH